MISVQLSVKLKRLVAEQVKDIIPSKHVYLYNIPEDVDRLKTLAQ
ncbi:tail protein [Staphylococcus phage S-CoN_Ph13]|nr:tail protein [Staphylococcus phage S-CoN_Ph13]